MQSGFFVRTFAYFCHYNHRLIMSPIKTKFFQLRIEEELKERAEKAAQRKGLSLASLFRLYLIEGLEKDERKWGDGDSGKK